MSMSIQGSINQAIQSNPRLEEFTQQLKSVDIDVKDFNVALEQRLARGENLDVALDKVYKQFGLSSVHADLKTSISNTLNSDSEFNSAVASLQKPQSDHVDWNSLGNLSPGSLLGILMAQTAQEQRSANKQLKQTQSEMIVDSIKQQAEHIKNAAIMQGVASIVSGAASLAGSALTLKSLANSSSKPSGTLSDSDKMIQAGANMKSASEGMNKNQAMTSLNSMFSGSGQIGAGLENSAERIEKANEEQLRATKENLQAFDDALRDLVQQSIKTQSTLVEQHLATQRKVLV